MLERDWLGGTGVFASICAVCRRYSLASSLGLCETGGLTLGRGVSFGNLALFAAGGGFGYCSSFGSAGSFESFGSCGASSGFSFTQGAAHGGVSVIGLVVSGCFCCATRGGLCCGGSGFCFSLCKKSLLADLFGGTMTQLRAVLAA